MKAVRCPVTCCPACWQSYSLPDWEELKPSGKRDTYVGVGNRAREYRLCTCGADIGLDRAAAAEWDIWIPADEYFATFPGSTRVAEDVDAGPVVARLASIAAKLVRPLVVRLSQAASRRDTK